MYEVGFFPSKDENARVIEVEDPVHALALAMTYAHRISEVIETKADSYTDPEDGEFHNVVMFGSGTECHSYVMEMTRDEFNELRDSALELSGSESYTLTVENASGEVIFESLSQMDTIGVFGLTTIAALKGQTEGRISTHKTFENGVDVIKAFVDDRLLATMRGVPWGFWVEHGPMGGRMESVH